MEAEPRLGTCSGSLGSSTPRPGKLLPEYCGDDTVVGPTKFYRMACFQEIGGFVAEVMWDGIDCHRCRQLGWIAESVDDERLRFIHCARWARATRVCGPDARGRNSASITWGRPLAITWPARHIAYSNIHL